MSLTHSPLLETILQVTILCKPEKTPMYLVGGAVRDLLLQKDPHDFDLVLGEEVRQTARKVADRLGGSYYVIDDERNTVRVLYDPPEKERVVIDFAETRGESIHCDLGIRDFTINGMALDVENFDQLIDPMGGAADLKDGLLRICTPTAFEDDPARLLRAVRLAVDLQLKMTPETTKALRMGSRLLVNVSAERQRDELFRMLDGHHPQTAVRLMDAFGLCNQLLPELESLKGLQQPDPHLLDGWEHTLACLEGLENLFCHVAGDYSKEAGNLMTGLAVSQLGRYRKKLEEHFTKHPNVNRSRRSLLTLALLYHDAGKPDSVSVDESSRRRFLGHEKLSAQIAVKRGRCLALSQDELDYLSTVIENHMRIHHLSATTGEELSRRAIYRYFRATEDVGIDTALASLADTMAIYQHSLPQEHWLRELNTCRTLFEAWWEKQDMVIKPPMLLNGNEIQLMFGVKEGPRIGQMLDVTREMQAAGELETKEAALKYLGEWLKISNAEVKK